MSYFKKSLFGFGWMGLFRVITRIGAFIRIAVLARLLTPSQFGLFGVASLMLSLFETFTQTGINIYLIQEKKRLESYVNEAWLVSIIRGILIFILLFVFTPYITSFFKIEKASALIILVGFVALLRGFINPSRVKFQKDLEFNKEFNISFFVFIIDFSVTIILAFVLRSPISMVYGLIAGAITEVAASFIWINPKPVLKFRLHKTKEMFHKGKWVTMTGIFNYLFQQGDDIVVGRLLTTHDLGVYQAAYRISTLPITEVSLLINQIMFPVFTNINNDIERLKKAFIKTILLISAVMFPISILFLFFPELTINIVLGNQWIEAAPVLRLLALFGVIRAIIVSTYPVFNSLKKQKYITYTMFISLIVMAVFLVPLTLKYKLLGAGISAFIGLLSSIPFVLYYLNITLRKKF